MQMACQDGRLTPSIIVAIRDHMWTSCGQTEGVTRGCRCDEVARQAEADERARRAEADRRAALLARAQEAQFADALMCY